MTIAGLGSSFNCLGNLPCTDPVRAEGPQSIAGIDSPLPIFRCGTAFGSMDATRLMSILPFSTVNFTFSRADATTLSHSDTSPIEAPSERVAHQFCATKDASGHERSRLNLEWMRNSIRSPPLRKLHRYLELFLLALQIVTIFWAAQRPAYGYVDPGSGLFAVQIISTTFAGMIFILRRKLRQLVHRVTGDNRFDFKKAFRR